MNVYAILVVLGQIVASIGPWPSDLAACQANMPQSNKDIDAAFADETKLNKMRKGYPNLQRNQVQWICIESPIRPPIKNAIRPND